MGSINKEPQESRRGRDGFQQGFPAPIPCTQPGQINLPAAALWSCHYFTQKPPVTLHGLASFPICCRNYFIHVTVSIRMEVIVTGLRVGVVTKSGCETCFCHFSAQWHWVNQASPLPLVLAAPSVNCWYCPSHFLGNVIKWEKVGGSSLLTMKCSVSTRHIYFYVIYRFVKALGNGVFVNTATKTSVWGAYKEALILALDSEGLILTGGWGDGMRLFKEAAKAHSVFGDEPIVTASRGRFTHWGAHSRPGKSWDRFLWRLPTAGPGGLYPSPTGSGGAWDILSRGKVWSEVVKCPAFWGRDQQEGASS